MSVTEHLKFKCRSAGVSRALSKHLFCPSKNRWRDAQWQLPLSDFENLRDIM